LCLKKSLLGKRITSELLKEIQTSDQVSDLVIAGEGGEYESFVIDAPFFPSRIQIIKSKIHWDEFREVGYFEIVKAALVPKKTD
jgi:diphthamide synthase (EF-2-diphthine--ammonia ligase)